MILLDT